MIWLGQTVIALMFRHPADPQRLAIWIPFSLLAYSLWHLLRAVCRGPMEPFDWTPAEQELLARAPLDRRDLVLYRLTAVGSAAVVKAACFCLVMLPDLPCKWAGFLGLLLALMFVDLARMGIEITTYAMSPREFMKFRVVILLLAGTGLVSAVVQSVSLPDVPTLHGPTAPLAIGVRFLTTLIELRTTWVGWMLESPFHVFGRIILAPGFSVGLIGALVLAGLLVAGGIQAIIQLDQWCYRRRVAAERQRFRLLLATPAPPAVRCPLHDGRSVCRSDWGVPVAWPGGRCWAPIITAVPC